MKMSWAYKLSIGSKRVVHNPLYALCPLIGSLYFVIK